MSVVARHVNHIDREDGGDARPGDFQFATRYGDASENPKPCAMLFICPCGCGKLNALDLRGPHANHIGDARPSWDWDGNRERPTLMPSILDWNTNEKGEKVSEHWHGYLTAGVFKACGEP